MKKLRLLILIILSSCTMRDYEVFKLSESLTTSNQVKHIKNIQKIDNTAEKNSLTKSYCKSYPLGYGAFTLSCQL